MLRNLHSNIAWQTYIQKRVDDSVDVILGITHEGRSLQEGSTRIGFRNYRVHCIKPSKPVNKSRTNPSQNRTSKKKTQTIIILYL